MDINKKEGDNFHLNAEDFELLFRQNFILLCLYCRNKYDLDLDVSKEIVSAAFIKLWESRSNITAEQSVKAYLYKIIDNRCLDVLKHERVKDKYRQFIQFSSSDHAQNTFDEISIKELSAAIDSAISELPEQMRKVFELNRFEGLKYAQIAAHLGISVKTVETQMSRALAKLREKLAGYLTVLLALLLSFL